MDEVLGLFSFVEVVSKSFSISNPTFRARSEMASIFLAPGASQARGKRRREDPAESTLHPHLSPRVLHLLAFPPGASSLSWGISPTPGFRGGGSAGAGAGTAPTASKHAKVCVQSYVGGGVTGGQNVYGFSSHLRGATSRCSTNCSGLDCASKAMRYCAPVSSTAAPPGTGMPPPSSSSSSSSSSHAFGHGVSRSGHYEAHPSAAVHAAATGRLPGPPTDDAQRHWKTGAPLEKSRRKGKVQLVASTEISEPGSSPSAGATYSFNSSTSTASQGGRAVYGLVHGSSTKHVRF